MTSLTYLNYLFLFSAFVNGKLYSAITFFILKSIILFDNKNLDANLNDIHQNSASKKRFKTLKIKEKKD